MSQTAAPSSVPHLRPLVIGLLAGPVVWSLYHIAIYVLIETACKTGLLTGRVAGGLTAASLVVLALTALSLIVVVWAGFASYRSYQRRQSQIHDADETGSAETAARFLTLTAVLLSALFALLILLGGIPALFLSPCVTV